MRNKHKLSKLPGSTEAYVDVSTIVAVRHDPHAEPPMVVVHTDQGFAIALISETGDSSKLMVDVMDMVKRSK